jgi:hypothetical protein
VRARGSIFVIHFRPPPGVNGVRALKAILKIALRHYGLAVERALMAAVQGQADSKPKGRIVASYDYTDTDADGTLLYQVLRGGNGRHRASDDAA